MSISLPRRLNILCTALVFACSFVADSASALETKASFYGAKFAGKKTASGKPFNPNGMTAASKTLPLGSKVLVKNKKTGKQAAVTITDRGPYKKGRGIDLSKGAAKKIGMSGVAPVKVKPLKIASKHGQHKSLASR